MVKPMDNTPISFGQLKDTIEAQPLPPLEPEVLAKAAAFVRRKLQGDAADVLAMLGLDA